MPRKKSKKKSNVQTRKAAHKPFAASAVVGGMLFVVAGIMPLVVRMIWCQTPPELSVLIRETQYMNFLSYWKRVFLYVPALVIAIYFFGELFTGGFNKFDFKACFKSPPIIAVGVYIVFVTLSNIFSPYPYTALHGTRDRCEGLFAQLAYLVLFLAAMYYVRSMKQVKIIVAGLLFSSLVMGAIGLSQLLGHDFFKTPLAGWLVMGEWTGLEPQFNKEAYSTLFNPNTYGLYAAMLAPFLLLCGFTYQPKAIIEHSLSNESTSLNRVLERVGGTGRLINLLLLAAGALIVVGIPGSRSLGGTIGAAAAIVILTAVYTGNRLYMRKRPSRWVFVGVAVLLAVFLAAYAWVPRFKANVTQLSKKLLSSFTISKAPLPMDYVFEEDTLSLIQDGITQVTLKAEGTASSSGDGEWLTVYDGEGNRVEPSVSVNENGLSSEYVYEVPEYGSLKLTRLGSRFTLEELNLSVENGRFYLYNQHNDLADLQPAPAIGFKGYEAWATYRGFIWSRSLPLLLKRPILGSGSDSFINEFPQNDIIGKKRFMYDTYIVVDKAHNLYLQTGITTGWISMLALMFLLGYYIVTTLVSLIKSAAEPLYLYGMRLGLLAAVCAFAVSSLATDSTIGSTGVFYILLGLGYALNKQGGFYADNSNQPLNRP